MSTSPVMACVALGANLGDAVATVQQALRDVASLPDTRLVKASSLYRSAPYEAQGPDFINAVVQVQTTLDSLSFLSWLQSIENMAGRERPYRNAPRTLDLDILLWGDERMATPRLTVPHPRMWERAFVLVPLAEIAPERVPAAALQAVQDQAIRRLDVT